MTNKRNLSASALLILPALLLFTACDPDAIRGDGNLVTETRNEKDFDGLEVSVPGKINLKHGANFKVEVQVEENLLPYLVTEVEPDGNLHIYFSREVRDVDGLVVWVTMPELESVQMSGSAELVTDGIFEGASLDLDVSGSGEIRMNFIDYDDIDIQLSGSGYIELEGTGGELNAHVSGSGDIVALDCPVREAEVHVSGSGTVKVDVAQKLTAHISGSGDVYYQGSPVVDSEISGSGRVVKI
ncbi:MAG TPA: head GIN domain-containing protein [Saprospiraceae bacterium]|nr:head GIN domain-containing protein [Saprospiraceae bacterium]